MSKSTSSFTHGNKYETIQVLRFICALMVMILHACFYTIERLDSNCFHYYQGFIGVKLFFAISGFVMIISSENLIENPNGWRIFGLKRIIRIVPIYWIMTTYKLIILLFASSLVFHARLDWLFIRLAASVMRWPFGETGGTGPTPPFEAGGAQHEGHGADAAPAAQRLVDDRA